MIPLPGNPPIAGEGHMADAADLTLPSPGAVCHLPQQKARAFITMRIFYSDIQIVLTLQKIRVNPTELTDSPSLVDRITKLDSGRIDVPENVQFRDIEFAEKYGEGGD